jgi:hypothetical protein
VWTRRRRVCGLGGDACADWEEARVRTERVLVLESL